MIFSHKILTSILLSSIFTYNVQASILDLFFGIEPPLKEKVKFTNKKVLNKTFIVRTSCSYHFELHLIHKEEEGMNFHKDLYPNRTLPIELNLKVFLTGKDTAIFNKDIKPKLQASGEQFTKFSLADIRLKEGKYKTILLTKFNTKELQNYNFNFVIGVISKSSCK